MDKSFFENCRDAVLAFLQENEIPFSLKTHPAAASMEECESVAKLHGAALPRNLFLQNRQGTDFYLLITEESKPFRTAELSKKINTSRLSFGTESKLFEFLCEYAGAVNPFGLMFDKEKKVRFVVDKALTTRPYLVFHPMLNTQSVKISADDFMFKFLPAVGIEPLVVELTGQS